MFPLVHDVVGAAQEVADGPRQKRRRRVGHRVGRKRTKVLADAGGGSGRSGGGRGTAGALATATHWSNGRDGSRSDGLVSQDEAHAGLDDDSFVTGGQRGRRRSGASILLVGRVGRGSPG